MDLVFIHGRPAAGKLTVANALGKATGYPVFHNHLVLDVLTTVFPFGSEAFIKLRERIWLDVFTEASRANTSLIFTFAPESTVPAGFPLRAQQAVGSAGGAVHFIRLEVSLGEQERRISLPSRRNLGKLSDLETLRRSPTEGEQPPSDLVIDTEEQFPEAAAATIIARFRLRPQIPVHRYS